MLITSKPRPFNTEIFVTIFMLYNKKLCHLAPPNLLDVRNVLQVSYTRFRKCETHGLSQKYVFERIPEIHKFYPSPEFSQGFAIQD